MGRVRQVNMASAPLPTNSIQEVATHNIVLTSAQPPAFLILDDSEHHHPALDLCLPDLSPTAKVLHYYNDDVVARMYHRQENEKKRLSEQEKHGIHPLEIWTVGGVYGKAKTG